jgi:hypothetical protein
MAENQYRFDPLLRHVNADKLKPMVRIWGGQSKMRKNECIAWIRNGLSDPASIRAALQNLEPWELNALAILKKFGNQMSGKVLDVALRATGVEIPHRINNSRWGRQDALVNTLFRRGLILSGDGSPGYFYSYGSRIIFTDERLTEQAPPLTILPFDIKPTATPKNPIHRRPPTVILDVIGLLQAINDMGGLRLTKKGNLRVAEVKKLRKAMKWPEKGINIDGIFFPDPTMAWVDAFRHSDLLTLQGDILVLRESPEQFATQSYADQVRYILEGLLRSNVWSEMLSTGMRHHDQQTSYQLRQALLTGLKSLSLEDGFFSIDDFEFALFTRIGEHFSLGYLEPQPSFYRNETPAQQRQALAEWRAKLRNKWQANERSWIEAALKTWVYFLGLVELALDEESISGFRLTQLGRAVLHPEMTASPQDVSAPVNDEISAWVVQPNFDVVAYLEQISASQLAFLERFAEREQANQHTALFHLTRHSVYRGLESGVTLNDLLQGLEHGAKTEIPQNVRTEIHEWAALREQITLYHRARLLEFPDEHTLTTACQQKRLHGKVIGDRFLLLTGKVSKIEYPGRKNYALALPPCLSITEQGRIRIQSNYHDLWIAAQLDQWAERTSDGWQLTSASVSDAIQSRKKLTDFLNLLSVRLKRPLPKFTRLALWAWSGRNLNVEMGTEIVLRCRDDEVYAAVTASRQLRPFIQGELTHNTLLINPDDLERVTEVLDWAGLEISAEFEVHMP